MGVSLKSYKFETLLEREDGWVPKNPLYDVQFQILDHSGEIAGEIKCHKLLLSLVSPVFRDLFFTGAQPRKVGTEGKIETVEVKGYSLISFQTLIRFLYNGEEEMFKKLELDDLFQLFLLADQYQVWGLKQLVRSYIQKAEIKLYTDTFQLLVKYDDHFYLENVCADVYRKCVQRISEKCVEDGIEFSSYVEEIIGDNLQMKNIVYKKLTAEFANLNKESEAKDELSTLKRKLYENDAREAKKFLEIKELVAATDKKIITVKNNDQKEISKIEQLFISQKEEFDSLTNSFSELQKKISDNEDEIVQCLNCRYFDCKDKEKLMMNDNIYTGTKFKVSVCRYHACKESPINGISKDVRIPAKTEGIMKKDFNIEFHLSSGKIINCHCRKKDNVYYKCK